MALAQQTTEIAERSPGGPLQIDQVNEGLGRLVQRVPRYTPQADLLETTRSITTIDDAETRRLASGYGGDLQREKRNALEHYKPFKAALHQAHGAVCDLEVETIRPFDQEVERLKKLAVDYDKEQERIRLEEERRQREEALRKQREEQARLEKEAQERAAAIAEQARIDREAAEQLEREARERGQAEEAERLKLEAEEAERAKLAEADAALEQGAQAAAEVEAEPVYVPAVAPQRIAGETKRVTYGCELVDLLELCKAVVANPAAYLQYVQLNDKVAAAAARSQKTAFSVPGLKLTSSNSIALQASR